jgi:hypothetical protein
MFLNIITPCSRPQNLISIFNSINIPTSNYRWIVVFDLEKIPFNCSFNNTEFYAYKDISSSYGNCQRNYGLSLVNNGHIYFNDDDTTLHPLLWNNIQKLYNYDFISFDQLNENNKLRLTGNKISIGHIDSHNFICSYKLCKDLKWNNKQYGADGIFASQCFSKCDKHKSIYINKCLSIYNSLR